jgi:Predicted permeases
LPESGCFGDIKGLLQYIRKVGFLLSEIIILFLIGLASGIVSGMGIGGGTILIPALVLFVNPGQHVAQSINLLFFIPTAIVALFVHIKNKRIDFKMAIPIIIFGFLGAYIGSKLAISLPGKTLGKYFGIFLLAMGAYEIIRKK